MTHKNIAVLLSGGVDSSLVVHLLCEQGYKPHLFYIQIGNQDKTPECSSEEDVEMCRYIARKYGLELDVVDLHQAYWDSVVAYLVAQAKKGLTPNPDVMCNKLIKFGCFEELHGKDFDKTATGHYATVYDENGRYWLGTSQDILKDQTDFLCQINYAQLSKLIFPIGTLTKSQVREQALLAALPSACRKDSQGICFLGKTNYNDLLKYYLGEQQGKVVELNTGKVLGTHSGYWFYTIGQRKGLGFSQGPWFVVHKDIAENVVYVANGNDITALLSNQLTIDHLHFITENPKLSTDPTQILFKIRHSPEFHRGTICLTQQHKWIVKSDEEIRGISPGQFGVIYDPSGRICYGGGEISASTPN